MDGVQTEKPIEGEAKEQVAAPQTESQPTETEQPAPAGNPTAETTETNKAGEETTAEKPAEPAEGMTAEQFRLYNETLRRVSKTANASLPDRYNAFDDTEVKALVKQQVMAGESPNIVGIVASVVTRLTPPPETPTVEEKEIKKDNADEVLSLKAELALLKAGISPERLNAAKLLFIAEGGDLDKVAEFVAKYPEWHKQEGGGVVFTQAPPLAGKTAPTPASQPVMTDFEKRVAAARKKAGLE